MLQHRSSVLLVLSSSLAIFLVTVIIHDPIERLCVLGKFGPEEFFDCFDTSNFNPTLGATVLGTLFLG